MKFSKLLVNHNHLYVEGISHKYRSIESDKWTLKSIDLDLNPGELVGIVGPSGSGKTTLLRLIAGFETPNKGKIVFNGIEISNPIKVLPPERRSIGMVFQDYALFPHLNVFKNICFGLSKNSNLDRVHWLLDLLGISEFYKRYPHELSGGQRQRVALARALAPGTSLILLDEPFCSLDQDVRTRLRNELSTVLKSCNASALFVTHDSQEALSICNRVAVINEGVIHQFAPPSELVDKPLTPFVGKFLLQRNLLPISLKKNKYETPIAHITFIESLSIDKLETIMFDHKSIDLELKSDGNAIVKSKEFMSDHWMITIEIDQFLIRVMIKSQMILHIGDRCEASFKSKAGVLLFPGVINASIS